MKNTDVALVILIAAVSVAISYFLGNAILGDPNDRVTTVDYMETISDTVEEPDVESFNPYTLNPTVEVYVGDCTEFDSYGVCQDESSNSSENNNWRNQ